MIEARELTKRYDDTTAVHSLSFTIAPGTVTGFLGPNGAGKSTTMRMIMGLDRPTSGTLTSTASPTGSTVPRYARSAPCWWPCTPTAAPPHLRSMAATYNIKASRVSEVIEMTGLARVATKRVGGFSLGMGQRLGIAAALLGDPRTLILDEPVNEGSTPRACSGSASSCVPWPPKDEPSSVSSHLMSEMYRPPTISW